jgi:hypothetical protein
MFDVFEDEVVLGAVVLVEGGLRDLRLFDQAVDAHRVNPDRVEQRVGGLQDALLGRRRNRGGTP